MTREKEEILISASGGLKETAIDFTLSLMGSQNIVSV